MWAISWSNIAKFGYIKFLLRCTSLFDEKSESIEQLRILENDFNLFSVSVEPSLPSINVPGDKEIVHEHIRNSEIQVKLLEQVLAFDRS